MSMANPDDIIINQHPFRTTHIDKRGNSWLECGACKLIVLAQHARRHVEMVHGAVEEVLPQGVLDFDARVAHDEYPSKHLDADGFKAWLIEEAKKCRDDLLNKHGEAASPDVQREMLKRWPEETEAVEWRFLGALWPKKHFVKTGEFRKASRGRMAPVWRRR